jgi:hypothetical protein
MEFNTAATATPEPKPIAPVLRPVRAVPTVTGRYYKASARKGSEAPATAPEPPKIQPKAALPFLYRYRAF